MATSIPPPSRDLGWDPGWAAAFLPFDAAGWRPARVVAAHRDAWVLATPAGDRDAVIAGRLRHEALGPGDLPAVGDWVAAAGLDGRRHGRDPGRAAPPHRVPAQHERGRHAGRPCRRAGAGRQRRRRASWWRASTATSTCAASSATSPSRGPAARPRSSCSTRPTSPRDLDGLRVAAEAVAPGRRGPDALRPHRRRRRGSRRRPPGAGPHGGRARLVGRRQVHARQRAARPRAPAHQRASARTTRAAATRPRTASSSACPAGALLIDTPGIRSLGVAGAADGLEPRLRRHRRPRRGLPVPRLPPRGRARLRRPGRPRRRPPGRRRASRAIASSSGRRPTSPARATRSLREAERRRWKAIQRLGRRRHMKHKYGSDQ